MSLENINSDVLHKAVPSLAMVFSTSNNKWEKLTSNYNSSFIDEINFAEALNAQKAAQKYLFIYDNNIQDWRPITKT